MKQRTSRQTIQTLTVSGPACCLCVHEPMSPACENCEIKLMGYSPVAAARLAAEYRLSAGAAGILASVESIH